MTYNANKEALINAALEVAESVPVFPCNSNKKPVCKNGFYDATQEPDTVIEMFSCFGAELIGIPTGSASGISVIDIDVHNEKDGEAWKSNHRDLLDFTRIASTPSGGYHYYYHHAEGVRNRQGIDGCVDVRGEGGYVIHASSRGYNWLTEDESLAPFPDAFRHYCSNKKSKGTDYKTLSIEKMEKLRDSYDGQGWNHIASTICYSAFEHGWSNHQFSQFVAPICDKGAGDPDLAPIIASIRKTRGTIDTENTTPISQSVTDDLPLSCVGEIDINTLKPRELIHGLDYIAGTISLTVAAGGVGKSMLIIFEACQIAHQGKNVMLLMLEDDPSEVKRRVKACTMLHEFDESAIGSNLVILHDETRLTIAGLEQNKPVAIDAKRLMNAARIHNSKVLIADPFVQTHLMNENDNGQINFVADQYRSIAKELDISVMLVHHTRKGSENGTRGENARGASALKDAARNVRELRQLSEADAAELNIDKDFAHEFICVEHTKANYTRRAEPRYMRKKVVQMPYNQSSATVENYLPETYEDLVTDEHRQKISAMIIQARKIEHPFVQNVRQNSRDIYSEGAKELLLSSSIIKKLVGEMLKDGLLECRELKRSKAALAVVGVE